MGENKKNATIIDVAKMAGVSIATVSRYLNSTSYVSEEKKKKIIKAIHKLDYKPSRFAKAMRRQRLFVIGIIVPHIVGDYYARIVNIASIHANARGYETIISVTEREKDLEDKIIDFFITRRVDGIITCTPSINMIEKLINLSIPVVAIDWSDPIGDLDIDSISISNKKAAHKMIKYLYCMGHKNILIITGRNNIPSSNERLCAVLEFQKRHPDLNIVVKEGNFSPKNGYQITKDFIDRKGLDVTAIFSFNDMMAFGALSALSEKDLNVPNDISIVGFDNSYISRYTIPPLTTIEQPKKEMGKEAVNVLINRIESKNTRMGHEIVLPHRFIERASVKNIQKKGGDTKRKM